MGRCAGVEAFIEKDMILRPDISTVDRALDRVTGPCKSFTTL